MGSQLCFHILGHVQYLSLGLTPVSRAAEKLGIEATQEIRRDIIRKKKQLLNGSLTASRGWASTLPYIGHLLRTFHTEYRNKKALNLGAFDIRHTAIF